MCGATRGPCPPPILVDWCILTDVYLVKVLTYRPPTPIESYCTTYEFGMLYCISGTINSMERLLIYLLTLPLPSGKICNQIKWFLNFLPNQALAAEDVSTEVTLRAQWIKYSCSNDLYYIISVYEITNTRDYGC